MLGFFNEDAHREWLKLNPEKAPKPNGASVSIWHHYEGGTRCDRTRKPRETDVKLTCTSVASSPTSVSMYLLEPKTCQYILVVESPIVCDILKVIDEDGLVQQYKLDLLMKEESVKDKIDTDGTTDVSKTDDNTTEDSKMADSTTEDSSNNVFLEEEVKMERSNPGETKLEEYKLEEPKQEASEQKDGSLDERKEENSVGESKHEDL